MEGHTLNLLEDYSNQQISNIALGTGKLIDHIINTRIYNIIKMNARMEASILEFRSIIEQGNQITLKDYDNCFGIKGHSPYQTIA